MLPARYPSGGRPVAAVTLYNPLTVAGAVTALAPIGSSAPCSLLIPWNSSVGEPSPLRYANFNLSVNALQRPWLGSASGSHRRICVIHRRRSEEHTSELQSLMRISSDVFCLQKKTKT